MNLNEYQERAMTTCMPSSDNFAYMFLNLVGEVGEFASKVAKHIRKEEMGMNDNELTIPQSLAGTVFMGDSFDALKKEAGDILWQLSGLCTEMGWTLDEVAEMNLEKLASRKERGKIDGSGDYR